MCTVYCNTTVAKNSHMSVVLVNNFTASIPFTFTILIKDPTTTKLGTPTPFPICAALVVPKEVLIYIYVSASSSSSMVVRSAGFVFSNTPFATTLYYSTPNDSTVFAYFIYDVEHGIAYYIPNILIASAFFNSFGSSGFYASDASSALVPYIPFSATSNGTTIQNMNFIPSASSGIMNLTNNGQFSKVSTSGGTVSAQPLTSWNGVIRYSGSGGNIIIGASKDVPNTIMSMGTDGKYSALAGDLTTAPGFFYASPASGYAFTPSTTITDATVDMCTSRIIYGCSDSTGNCALQETNTGYALCRPSLLGNPARVYTPTVSGAGKPALLPWSVSVFAQFTTGGVQVNLSAGNGNETSNTLYYGKPLVISGFMDAIDMTVNMFLDVKTSRPSQMSTVLWRDMCPAVLPWTTQKGGLFAVEYGSVTKWFDPSRNMAYVYIVPQTVAGYMPLYGILPTPGLNSFPGIWGNNRPIMPGDIFTINSLVFVPSTAGSKATTGGMPTMVTLLTHPLSGLPVLNVVGADGLTLTPLAIDASNNLVKAAKPANLPAGSFGLVESSIIAGKFNILYSKLGKVYIMVFEVNSNPGINSSALVSNWATVAPDDAEFGMSTSSVGILSLTLATGKIVDTFQRSAVVITVPAVNNGLPAYIPAPGSGKRRRRNPPATMPTWELAIIVVSSIIVGLLVFVGIPYRILSNKNKNVS